MSVEGIWDLTVATPIGTVEAVVELRRDGAGYTGVAHGTGEEVPLKDVALTGDRLTWKQSVTRPLRLNLSFDVTADGDTLRGTSRAGRLPASRVHGERRPADTGTDTGTDTDADTDTDTDTDAGTGGTGTGR